MENHNDELIMPEADVEIHAEPVRPKPKKKTTLFIALASVVFVALAGALVFVILNNNRETASPQDTQTEDYFKYDSSVFSSIMDSAEDAIAAGDYLSAREQLNNYNLTERMTASQKYRFYSIFASIYDETALNDATLHDRYQALADQSLEEIRKGE